VRKILAKEEEGGGGAPKAKEEVQNEKLDMKLDALLAEMRLLKEAMPGVSGGTQAGGGQQERQAQNQDPANKSAVIKTNRLEHSLEA
jgi:hypothetical protein